MRGSLVIAFALLGSAEILSTAHQARVAGQIDATPGAPPALQDLLDGYWRGDFAIVRRELKTGDAVAVLVPRVRVWIATTAVRGWREGALVLILDLADAAVRLPQPNPKAASQLIAAGYEEITRKPDRNSHEEEVDRAFENRWHEAAVGILEGARDGKQIIGYVKRIEQRYEIGLPARFWLARGFALGLSETSDRVVAAYDHAARDPALRAEASARAAMAFVSMQRYRDAVRRLDLAGDPGNDLALASLLPFVRGLALTGLGEHQQALVALDQALAFNPESVTVRQARARTLRALGRATEDVPDRSPADRDAASVLADGDFRFVPNWLATLKIDLRTSGGTATKDRSALFAMLDQYFAGEHRRTVEELIGRTSLEQFSLELRNSADAWIKEGGEESQAQREMAVAAVVLEAAHARGVAEWPRAQLLLEWTCDRLRARLTPSEAERVWMWAAAALMEGVVQGAALEVHVTHALKRFPGDPALTMARALAAELRAGPDVRSSGGLEPPGADQIELLVQRLKQASSLPGYRMEAQVRLGYTALRQRRHKDAFELLEPVTGSDDPFLRYLAHLFRGRALDGQRQFAEAVTEYESALTAAPGAQTAEIALATALARVGRRDEATVVAERALKRSGTPFDPWLAYGQGDLRRWPDIIENVRRTLR